MALVDEPQDRVLTRENGGVNSAAMQAELDALEANLTQLLERYQSVRQENMKLRQQLVTQENANRQLSDKLAEARTRLETLFNKLPD